MNQSESRSTSSGLRTNCNPLTLILFVGASFIALSAQANSESCLKSSKRILRSNGDRQLCLLPYVWNGRTYYEAYVVRGPALDGRTSFRYNSSNFKRFFGKSSNWKPTEHLSSNQRQVATLNTAANVSLPQSSPSAIHDSGGQAFENGPAAGFAKVAQQALAGRQNPGKEEKSGAPDVAFKIINATTPESAQSPLPFTGQPVSAVEAETPQVASVPLPVRKPKVEEAKPQAPAADAPVAQEQVPQGDKSFSKSKEAFDSLVGKARNFPKCTNAQIGNRGQLKQNNYIDAVVLSFARTLCRPDSDPVKQQIGRATYRNGGRDALVYYQENLPKDTLKKWFGQSNVKLGKDSEHRNIISTYALILPMGMRETGGRYASGRDRAGQYSHAKGAEAGLFQASYDAQYENLGGGRAAVGHLISEYTSGEKSCLTDRIVEARSKSTHSGIKKGHNGAEHFQRLNLKCPAFSIEAAAVQVRFNRKGFGPVNRFEAKPVPACNEMLETVYQEVQSNRDAYCPHLSPQRAPATAANADAHKGVGG